MEWNVIPSHLTLFEIFQLVRATAALNRIEKKNLPTLNATSFGMSCWNQSHISSHSVTV